MAPRRALLFDPLNSFYETRVFEIDCFYDWLIDKGMSISKKCCAAKEDRIASCLKWKKEYINVKCFTTYCIRIQYLKNI